MPAQSVKIHQSLNSWIMVSLCFPGKVHNQHNENGQCDNRFDCIKCNGEPMGQGTSTCTTAGTISPARKIDILQLPTYISIIYQTGLLELSGKSLGPCRYFLAWRTRLIHIIVCDTTTERFFHYSRGIGRDFDRELRCGSDTKNQLIFFVGIGLQTSRAMPSTLCSRV